MTASILTPEFAAKVHENAVAKGFWPDGWKLDPHKFSACIELIHGEISEAAECVRDGLMGVRYDFTPTCAVSGDPIGLMKGSTQALEGKPIGFPVEIADVVLRCLDAMVAFNHSIPRKVYRKHEVDVSTTTATLAQLRRMRDHLNECDWSECLSYCYAFAEALDFDLDEVVRQKHEYNLTRPMRHGKLA